MKNNDEMVFALDEFQQRYLEDLETKEWLERVIRKAGEEQFPLLKANIKGKDLNTVLRTMTDSWCVTAFMRSTTA